MTEALCDFFKAKPKRRLVKSGKVSNETSGAVGSQSDDQGQHRIQSSCPSDVEPSLQLLGKRQTGGNSVQSNSVDREFVTLFWGDMAYFLEDMQRDIAWILAAACQGVPCPLRGNEKDVCTPPELKRLLEGVDLCHFRKLKILWGSPEHESIAALDHCFCRQGRIMIFPCKGSDSSQKDVSKAFKNHISQQYERQFVVPPVPRQLKQNFLLEHAVLVVFAPCGNELRFFHIFNPEKRKKHWAFVGGDVCFSKDTNYFAAIVREWEEEAGILLGSPPEVAFRFPIPQARPQVGQVSQGWYLHIEGGTVYMLTLASDVFFASTRQGRRMEMPDNGCYVRWDDHMNVQKVHTDGWLFVENDEFTWISEAQFDSGVAGTGKDQRPIRRENLKMVRNRHKSLWFPWALKVAEMERGEDQSCELPSPRQQDYQKRDS